MHRLLFFASMLIAACGSTEVDPLSNRDALPNGVADAGTNDVSDSGSADATTEPEAGVAHDAGVPDGGGPPRDGGYPTRITLGGDRPAPMFLPAGYDGAALPLVVLLHGYTVTGAAQDAYFRLSARVDDLQFFAIVPTGTRENGGQGSTFWNATDACCNFYGSTVDDVAYLDGLVAEARTQVTVDPKRIYFLGHSNGGFMAYRMACEATTEIAAIVSLAGATFFDPNDCVDPEPISVLQIHGTSDPTIFYGGVASGPMRYPGAVESLSRWAARAGCDTTRFEDGAPRDLDAVLGGSETTVRTYRDGCSSGLEAELWTIEGGVHIPPLRADFSNQVLEWMAAHPRP